MSFENEGFSLIGKLKHKTFCAPIYQLNYITQGGHLNPDLKMVDEGLSVSLAWWNLPSFQRIIEILINGRLNCLFYDIHVKMGEWVKTKPNQF